MPCEFTLNKRNLLKSHDSIRPEGTRHKKKESKKKEKQEQHHRMSNEITHDKTTLVFQGYVH